MSETQEQVLERILAALQSEESNDRLAALHDLAKLNYSSPAILQCIERMALNDQMNAVQSEARKALSSSAHRYIQGRLASLSRNERQHLLEEIETWKEDGLIRPEQAEILRQRYNFDFVPTTTPPVPAVASTPKIPPPAVSIPPEPAGPHPTLTERLLSQASVNIFLYLGAFLVIGAALILAALVEAARLPILLGVTVIFAASAIGLKKHLPQPSFALFIVFSFLLPILASVLADSLNLSDGAANFYWTTVYFGMAAIWAFSAWFYASRLFSLASFVSLTLAFLFFAEIFNAPTDWNVFSVMPAALIGLFGVRLLQGWKGQRFGLTLFVSAQILQAIVLLVSVSSIAIHLFSSDATFSDWAAITLTWLAAASFYAWSDSLFPSFLFPWASAACLLPISWLILQIFNASALMQIIGLFIWGTVFAFGSEFLNRQSVQKNHKFYLPLLFGSGPLFIAAALWGLSEKTLYGFICLTGMAIAYTVLHSLHPRGLVWMVALISGVAAYLVFFELPFLVNTNIQIGYKYLAISLLLGVPELLFKLPLATTESWRWPPFALGAFTTLLNMGLALIIADNVGVSAVIFTAYALFFAAYSLHFHRPVLGYLATASAALAMNFTLLHFDVHQWLPIFTGLAVSYFIAGFLLRGNEKTRAWGSMLRISGLMLGTIIALIALFTLKETGGWYILIVGALSVIETFVQPEDRIEMATPVLFSMAAFLILRDIHVTDFPYHLLAISLVWLITDAIYSRTLKPRRLAIVTRLAGGLIAGTNVLALLIPGTDAKQAALCFGVYAVFFAAYSWFYRKPLLGYAATASLPLSVFFTLRTLSRDNWLYEIVAIAVLFYAAGYVIRRRENLQGWSQMLLLSGLGIGTINSFSAPLRVGLDAAIPVAIAATLFAAEAFAHRNVWLGFPANLLYLEAYFLILIWSKVDEPQFFSVGTAILGMLMHYLLTRAGSKTGAFLTGMFSQLVLLGTTYIQLFSTERLGFFVVIFFQALAVLAYGIVIRSRSLVITPIIFIVLSVFTVIYGALKGISTVILIGCTGVILLLLGILAVVLRERLIKIGGHFGNWQA